MPLPLGIAASLGLTGALGLAQGVANALPTQTDKANKKRLEELTRLKQAGQLGLGGREEQLLSARLTQPVQQAAQQAQSRTEALQAASGGTSGADLSRLRTEQARTLSAGAQVAGAQVEAANLAAKRAQENEIEQRRAAVSQRKKDAINSIFGGATQAAGAAGAIAGSVPETLRSTGVAGAAIRDFSGLESQLRAANLPEEQVQQLLAMERSNPGSLTRIISQLQQQAQPVTDAAIDQL